MKINEKNRIPIPKATPLSNAIATLARQNAARLAKKQEKKRLEEKAAEKSAQKKAAEKKAAEKKLEEARIEKKQIEKELDEKDLYEIFEPSAALRKLQRSWLMQSSTRSSSRSLEMMYISRER